MEKENGKRKRSQNRSTQNQGYLSWFIEFLTTQNQGYLSRFIEFLTYKAELTGKRVIRIDEAYTSKECCICGK
ncbi:zinc ribbon domain-containing protein [Methanosarcina sp. WH1]|uniref:zinc ribbon domain-containing protein n=1 Tax=Methanosarcina sp. WH1 TaxID=1434102 RepID=UPI000698D1F2